MGMKSDVVMICSSANVGFDPLLTRLLPVSHPSLTSIIAVRNGPLYPPHTVSEDRITNWHSLESYLKTEEDKEQWLLRGSPDLTSSPSPGYWYGRQPGDYSSPLRKYHVSTRYVRMYYPVLTLGST